MNSKQNKSSGISIGYIFLAIVASSIYDTLMLAGGIPSFTIFGVSLIVKIAIVTVIIFLIENVTKPG